ncbi:hypothetical protein L1049_008609 [Liquidambar formosana]|uniref:non-specific serine/threonine protein kinase n=1 Tax=Liquidambar formosana TaxID=63359 RepID=A0AAP0X2F9_LIQFO
MDIPSQTLWFLLVHLCLIITTTTSSHISPGSTLYASSPNQTWSSPNNTFSLGFIPSTSTSTPFSFSAAINYNGIPIWQAGNPSTTVDSGASLQFLPSGNLRLVNGSGATVWESNTAGLGVSVATLEDSGNLVLKNGTISVWSSFEKPTDTIVPLQNFTTDKVLRNGLYSFTLASVGNLTLKWNDRIVYWTQGLSSSINASLSSPSLGLQSIGILSISDLALPTPVIMAYSSDYAEGSDILRFLRLDSDGNLRIYSSARGSGTITIRWAAVLDQCLVFGYCGNFGICSYNGMNPVCGCPSENFDPIDPKDSRKGCKRKVEIEDCPGNSTMLELEHTRFLTYPPESASQVFFVGITACRLNCIVAGSCVASTSLSDGSGLCYFKTPGFISGYQSPTIPSTSYVKVCGQV